MTRRETKVLAESSDEAASSKTSNVGVLSNTFALESRCFSPPETYTPPSPQGIAYFV